MEESESSILKSDELWDRYLANHNETVDAKVLGKTLRKIFPSITVLTGRGQISGKNVKTYKGIRWKELVEHPVFGLAEVSSLLPRSAMILEDTHHSLEILIPSNLVTNGNVITKLVTLEKESATWKVKVRGKSLNLEKLNINPSFELNADCVLNTVSIVDKILLCKGVQIDDSLHNQEDSGLLREETSKSHNENSTRTYFRSKHCTQAISWLADESSEACRSCQRAVCLSKKNSLGTQKRISSEEMLQNNTIELGEDDDIDLRNVLEMVFPNATEEMKVLLKSQHEALTSKRRRWDKDVLSVCLTLWVHSPKTYQTLQDSNMLILPSGRQLRRYKNIIPQHAGLNQEVLHWMYQAAQEANLPNHGRAGGLHHDETRVQQDIVLDMTGGTPTLVGWVDMGNEALNLRMLKQGEVKQEIATEVIQFTFVGYTGFRFPVCHFPTHGIKASELHICIWDIIAKLSDWGFQVDFIQQDGGEENRNFIKSHFVGDPYVSKYASPNICNLNRMVYHTQDFSHNMKKLRNGCLSSGDLKGLHSRKLELKEMPIVWKQWEDAVQWDRTVNSRPIHYKVTDSHLHPNISEKMRNHLAEDMLDENMLHLMECYRESLLNGSHLDSTVELLMMTSTMIKIFRDQRLISSIEDQRLSELRKVLDWFLAWKASAKENPKSMFSRECMDDVICMLVTFPEICRCHLQEFPQGSIKPSRFNNDIAENMFCQQKGLYNGNASNPSYKQYCSTVNSVLLGQSLKSRGRKSNAGLSAVQSYKYFIDEPFEKKAKCSKGLQYSCIN